MSAFSSRMTIFSPNCVGIVETRRSIRRPSNRSRLRPSCGLRRSAMSMPDMILRREMRRVLQMVGNGQHVVQQPVHALPDLQLRLVRLDVDVAGAGLGGVAQDEVDELHDRRKLDVLGERGRVDQVVLVVGARLDLARRLHRVEHVVGRRAIGLGVAAGAAAVSSQVCVTTTATAFFPVRNSTSCRTE